LSYRFVGKTTFFYTFVGQGCGFLPHPPVNSLLNVLFGMLKKDLIDKVSSELALQKQDVSLAVDIMLETMSKALIEERRIELRGFGSFSVRSRKPRSTKNPRTGKIMEIPNRKTLHFTMSKSLKEALISETD
jgi:integration host factor subunit beta